jgi:hypothetical protein
MRKPPSGIFYHREHYLIFGHSPKCLESAFSELNIQDLA